MRANSLGTHCAPRMRHGPQFKDARPVSIIALRTTQRGLIMIKTALTIVTAAVALAGPAHSENSAPDNEGGRYVFSKQADGFVRLDTQSGAVSLCREQAVGWACQAAPEDRALFESEIARLQGENAALKKTLLAHGLALPSGSGAEAPVAQDQSLLRLPSDADLDRLIAFAGQVWQRFVEAIARAQKQVFNKS